MKKIFAIASISLALGLVHSTALHAKVSPEEAKQLGTTLTRMGADPRPNADGTIPAYTGKMYGLPEGLQYDGPGTPYPDPYADDKILFTITAENVDQYADKLSEGQVALFKTYPDTFKMHIYPSHRDARYPDHFLEKVAYNAVHAELYNGDDGIRGFTGGVAFPMPKNGAEALWNSRTGDIKYTLTGVYKDIAVFPNGSNSVRTSLINSEYPYANPDNKVGMEEPELGKIAAYVLNSVYEPTRDKGMITAVIEPFDYATNAREVWRYLPGSRRVRRAPTVGYDTPDGPGGIVTVDDTLGFNGAMDRFDWKLLGKKEIYIPYHSYKFDQQGLDYSVLLPEFHVNPEYMRYELQRVWVVEATLREGKRHIYGKRRFYMAEDSWMMALTENFDGRGELWKAVLVNSIYEYNIKGIVIRSQIFHDLRAGAYVVTRLVNDQQALDHTAAPLGESYYTPTNIRKLGKR
jgi:hypothetical protein